MCELVNVLLLALTVAAVTLERKKILLVTVFRRAVLADLGELRHGKMPRCQRHPKTHPRCHASPEYRPLAQR